MSPSSWGWDERDLWGSLKISAKYCHTNVNVARNTNKKVKECDRKSTWNQENGNDHFGEESSEDLIML
jgi:hypothetical protein